MIVGLGKSASAATSDVAVAERFVTVGDSIVAIHDAAIVQHYARHLAWLEENRDSFNSAGQDDNKTHAIEALDTVMAEYGQQ